jgi:hypothetical protein
MKIIFNLELRKVEINFPRTTLNYSFFHFIFKITYLVLLPITYILCYILDVLINLMYSKYMFRFIVGNKEELKTKVTLHFSNRQAMKLLGRARD